MSRVHLSSLVTVAGAHTVPQAALGESMRHQLARLPEAAGVAQMITFVYARSDIRARHLELAPDELERRDDWYALTNEATFRLACRALDAVLAAGERAETLDGLVVVSSSYAGFPALSRRLQDRYRLPTAARCLDLTGLGCGGSTQGLELADSLVSRGTCKKVALICVDVMGTFGAARRHLRAPTMSQLVAHCLASDGAAALVVEREPSPRCVLSYARARLRTRLWPGTLALNDLTADADNQPLIAVGKDIRARLLPEVAPLLEQLEPGLLAMHPGGKALMQLLRARCPDHADAAELAMATLREHGNLGAPSALWVLRRALSSELAGALDRGGRCHLFALAPGIVTTLLTLEGARSHAA